MYTALCIFVLTTSIVRGNVIVQTESGKVEGVEVESILQNEKYYSFMGIFYAQAPVGALRFMPPLPHPGWSEVLDAKEEKPACAQHYRPVRKGQKFGFYGQEDCLHLSIHTPKDPNSHASKIPVIVFLYNEQFSMSANASKSYGPDFFMSEDVILVTISHRLGSLGFLSFGDDLLPGNNGIRDVILGLKWIQQNIKYFGGDENNVTLMGSNGGAVLVDILLHSPRAKGLYSRAILQSGSSWFPYYFTEKPREKAILFAETLDQAARSSSLLKKLISKVPVQEIVESEHLVVDTDEARAIQRAIGVFGPVIEHEHPDAVITKLPDASDLDVPVIIGYNSREGIELCERFLGKPQYLTFADRDFVLLFPRRVNYHFEINSNKYFQAIEEIKDFYFEESYVKNSRPGEYITYLGDIMALYPLDYTVRRYTNESSAPVYYYTFDYSGELNFRKKSSLDGAVNFDGTYGASLGDELCYLFVCNQNRKAYQKALADKDSEEIKVLRSTVRLWANFAKSGTPTNSKDKITWTPASADNRECLVISDELQMKSHLHQDRMKFWDDFINKYEKKAVNGIIKDERDEL